MFRIILFASVAAAFLWLVPHQPNLGFGHLQTIERLATSAKAKPRPIARRNDSRGVMLGVVARLRSDLHANGTQIRASSRNGTL